MRAALEAVARERFDLAIVVHSTPAMARLVWDAGVPLRQGNALRTHSWRYNVPVYQRRRVPAKHELDYNLDLVRPYVPVPERSGVEFHLRWSEAADRTVATFLGERNVGRFMIVHPGSGGSAVDLPVETLAAWIADYPYAGQFILTGTAAEKSLVDALASNCRKPVVATAGRFSLEELAALISRAECFISNSTGPLHIARALGRPLLGFYTTVPACHPKRWGPYGWERTHVLLPPGESFDHFEPNKRKSIANMARVTPAMITAALERIGQTP
jgi:ADP-heptose:LPS heptosyltransferase